MFADRGGSRGVMRRKTKREARKVLLELTEGEGELKLNKTTVRNLPFSLHGVQQCNENTIYEFHFWELRAASVSISTFMCL
jgi:hypothetical protein